MQSLQNDSIKHFNQHHLEINISVEDTKIPTKRTFPGFDNS